MVGHLVNIQVNIQNCRKGLVMDRLERELELLQPRRCGKSEQIAGSVMQNGRPVVVPLIEHDDRFAEQIQTPAGKNPGKLSFICVAIKLSGNSIGAISVDVPSRDDTRLQRNVRFLNIVSSIIAQAAQAARTIKAERAELLDENIHLRHELQGKYQVEGIVGRSSKIKEVHELVAQVAASDTTVLIRGQSGTGKELVANAIHYSSPRAEHAFVSVNCAALPESLLESELFGHQRGAFTGAVGRRKGRFQHADGGTIFLDEIGDLSQALQAKLLRVLQFKEFEPLGSDQTVSVDVRILAATSKDLEYEVQHGRFREDLYYRINVFPIFLPTLRERKGDIMLLADHFLEKYNMQNDKNIGRISTPAIDMLVSYHWPGNVRELENCMERAVLVCRDSVIRAENLPPSLQTAEQVGRSPATTLPGAVENLEREMILDALKAAGGHQGRAARMLGLTARMLGYKIRRYDINPRVYAGKVARLTKT